MFLDIVVLVFQMITYIFSFIGVNLYVNNKLISFAVILGLLVIQYLVFLISKLKKTVSDNINNTK
jgi:hypothetical protein